MTHPTLAFHPLARMSRPLLVALPAVLLAVGLHHPASAQQSTSAAPSATLLEEVVVTARKREESAQDVPLPITAYGAEQIDALKVRDLTSLAVGIPNVALDDIGTIKGVANFSIRGLGVNSSIPSIDPTVGVFVDGVYMGVNYGILFDTFDLESIEVLRGPQGTLFGRNVTGGAILLNSKKPGPERESVIKTAVDRGDDGGHDGLNRYLMGSTSGAISKTVNAKITAYYNDDDGWFENDFNGENFGELEQVMFRPSLVWTPNDDVELYVKYENMDIKSDGPAAQSHRNRPGLTHTRNADGTIATTEVPVPATDGGGFSRNSHKFSVDTEGFLEVESDLLSAQLDWRARGGKFTNIFGWRDLEQYAVSDIDAQPDDLFHAPIDLEADQWSNELRWNGLLMNDRLNFTAGLFYFTQDITYAERRVLNTDGAALPASAINPMLPGTLVGQILLDGGGEYEVETTALFVAGDYDLNDAWTLNLGIRYTAEEKDAKIASLIDNPTFIERMPINTAICGGDNRCNVVDGTCAASV